MAMTNYSSKLVHTGHCNGNSSKPIYVYVAYKSSQSTANNQSTMSVGMYVVTPSGWSIGKWTDYNGSYVGTTDLTFDGTIPNFEGTHWLVENKTFTVDHDDEGKATATIKWKWGVYSTWGEVTNPSGSFTVDLPTIARASTVSTSNGTLGTEQTLTVTRKATGYTHTITYKCGKASGTICTKSSSTEIKWTPPISLAQQNTTGSSVSITLTITTYNGSTQIGTAKTATFTASIPSSVKPTVVVSVADASGHIEKYGGFVQNQSQVEVTVVGTGVQGSTIKSLSVSAGSTAGSSSPLVGTLTAAPTDYAKGSVTDSRGRSSGVTAVALEVLPYSKPEVLAFSVGRCNADGVLQGDGEYAKATFSGKVSALNSINSAIYKVLYREQGTAAWTTVEVNDAAGLYAPAGVSVVFPANGDKAFEVAVSVSDDFEQITSSYRAIGVAFSLLQTTEDFTGLAIGQRAIKPYTFAVGIPAEFNSSLRFSAIVTEKSIEAGDDFNNYSLPGLYKVTSNADAKEIGNIPTALAGLLFVINVTGSTETSGAYIYVMQFYRVYNASHATYRRCLQTDANGEWIYGEWYT